MRIAGNAHRILTLFAVIAFSTTAACGGSGVERPEPLSHRFDDMHIAAVPIEEKQAVFEANNSWSVAKAERAKVQVEYDEAASELEVAGNELEKAKLDQETAESKKETADKSNDMERINSAAAGVRKALLTKRAAEQRIQYLEAQRAHLEVKLAWAEQNMYSKEAYYYQTMSRIAQQKNIRPPGVDYESLESQARERSESAQRLKAIADREQKAADSARNQWMEAKRAAEDAASNFDS